MPKCFICGGAVEVEDGDVSPEESICDECAERFYGHASPDEARRIIMAERAEDISERKCPSCGEVGDPTCFDGTGICGEYNATEPGV